ncbi:MoaF-related domain-containing protein [Kitasatospora terrestris]|uniref:MoaF-like domain-containing protein n=1 Tax=Kitasatospora terrestris TaxID=258051 RepID=A0ABP9DLD2_9ACTN
MKLRALAPLALAAVLAAGTTAAATGSTTGSTTDTADTANACRTPLGRSLQLTLDDGLVMRFDYTADGASLTGTILAAGDTGGEVGHVTTVPVDLAQVSTGVWLANWIEADDLTISLAQDMRTRTARTYWSYSLGDGHRGGESHSGTFTCLPGTTG